MPKDASRYTVFKILYRFFTTKVSLKSIHEDTFSENFLSPNEISFIINLVKGVLRDKKILDQNIFLYSKIKKVDRKTRILLYIGIYQLLYCNSVPNYAAINTTVDLSKTISKSSSGFINAILRKISKVPYKKTKNLQVNSPDIYYSYPEWLLNHLYGAYSNRIYSICEVNATQPPIWLRINTLRTNFNEISKKISANKIYFSQDPFLSNYIKVGKFDESNLILDLLKNGKLYVQNPSSGFIVKLLDPIKNDIILDACSAPGGKSSHIAELTQNNIDLTCMDIKKKRIGKIKENFSKLGVENVDFICDNAATIKTNKRYNKILLDLPCTSSGTIRKNPDIKWNTTKESIKKIKKLQYDILNNMKNTLTTRGEIIYSTCSILEEENHSNIIKFMKNNPDFHIPLIHKNIPSTLKNDLGGITILPDNNDYEGMFAIKIKKNA